MWQTSHALLPVVHSDKNCMGTCAYSYVYTHTSTHHVYMVLKGKLAMPATYHSKLVQSEFNQEQPYASQIRRRVSVHHTVLH